MRSICSSPRSSWQACCRHLAAVHRSHVRGTRAACRTAAAPHANGSQQQQQQQEQEQQQRSVGRKRVVFLGTPEVAAIVLQELLAAAQLDTASFEVAGVVSQPGKPRGRGNKAVPVPSPVEQLARQHLPETAVLCPRSAREPAFLEAFAAMQPDLAVTAAYGNMLPSAFLDLPKHGTLNIHPSLLPQYRGAAPVQRALQDGVATTGVSVAFTVLACDAGPVFLQEQVAVPADEQAPQLLDRLFRQGAQLLVANMEHVWSGEAARVAWPQDHARATHAAKIAKEEAQLDIAKSAVELHNQVRAFAGWPGTVITFLVTSGSGDAGTPQNQQQQQQQPMQVKVLQSRAVPQQEAAELLGQGAVPGQALFLDQGRRLLLPCGGGGALEVLSLQPPTKKPMQPRAFLNGLVGKQLAVQLPQQAAAVMAAAAAAAS